MKVLKNSGEIEIFQPTKMKKSLRNAKLLHCYEIIGDEIKGRKLKIIKSRDISQIIRKKLKNESGVYEYNLKWAISRLGPTGFPFEELLRQAFASQGFRAKSGVKLKGKAVSHEIDVIAKKDKNYFVECKFHANKRSKSDVKVTMYIYSRKQDLIRAGHPVDVFAVATNTRFTKDAIKFAKEFDLELISPSQKGVISLIDILTEEKIYPITSLYNLQVADQRKLLKDNIVTIDDFYKNRKILKNRIHSPFKKVLNEVLKLREKS